MGVRQAAAIRRAAAAGRGRRRGAAGRHVAVADPAGQRICITFSGHACRCYTMPGLCSLHAEAT